VNQLALAVDAEEALHPEVPLLTVLRLMHLRIPRARRVFHRRRHCDNRGVHDRRRADGHSASAQMLRHGVELRGAEAVFLEEMTKLADRRLVRRRFASQIDPTNARVVGELRARWWSFKAARAT
jgi:hypothetical protein